MPDPVSAVVGGVAGVGSALIGSSASSKASDAMIKSSEKSTKLAIAEQRRQFDKMLELTAPWRTSGEYALNKLNAVLGLQPQPIPAAPPQQVGQVFQPDPRNYQTSGETPANQLPVPQPARSYAPAAGASAQAAAPTPNVAYDQSGTPVATTNALPAVAGAADAGGATQTTSKPKLSRYERWKKRAKSGQLSRKPGQYTVLQTPTRDADHYVVQGPGGRDDIITINKDAVENPGVNLPLGTWDDPTHYGQNQTGQAAIKAIYEQTPPAKSSTGPDVKKTTQTGTDPTVTDPGTGTDPAYAPTYQFSTDELRNLPGYQYALEEGENAITRAMAARGMTRSGAYDKAILRHQQGMADQNYLNYLNPYFNMAGMGQVSAGQAASGAQAMGNAASNIYMTAGQQQGSARASNYANQGNIWGNALNNLAGGWMAYNQMR